MPGNKKSQRSGFTLLEVIVVVALFAILVIVVVDVYLLALRAQRQTSYRQKALSSARTVIETIARSVRTSEIDYSFNYGAPSGGIVNPESSLALIDQTGQKVQYILDNGRVKINTPNGLYLLTDSTEIQVVNLDFYINPTTSPLAHEQCGLTVLCSASSSFQPAGARCTAPTSSNNDGFCRCNLYSDCATTHVCAPNGSGENWCLPINQQENVTISVGFKTIALRPEDQKVVFIQTTVASRIYKR